MNDAARDSSGGVSSEDGVDLGYLLEHMTHSELIGRRVKLSDGREGPIVHVEYESPERVALVKTFPEDPSPLTRVAVDRLSPPHLPYITELVATAEERKDQ